MPDQPVNRITRREALWRLSLAGLALTSDSVLVSCAHTPRPSPIDWQPGIAVPVQAGYVDLGPGTAPGLMRIFFPSLSHPPDAAILPPLHPYPVVLFLHGHCSADADHYLRWYYLPYVLARCGYVVAVPDLPSIGTAPTADSADLETALRTLEFVRSDWVHADLVEPPPATGVVGHSFGAALGAYVVASDPAAYSAFVSLSGTFDSGVMSALLPRVTVPSFYTVGTGERAALRESFRHDAMMAFWRHVLAPWHRAVFLDAEHWDFELDTGCRRVMGSEIRGGCREAGRVATDLVAVFLGKYVVNPLTALYAAGIPDSLVYRPQVPRTREQRVFASSHLRNLERLSLGQTSADCRVELAWHARRGEGSRTLP